MSNQNKGVVALVILAFNFGLIAVIVRYLNFSLPLFQQLYLTAVTATLFGLIMFYKKIDFKKLKKIPRKDWEILLFRSLAGYVVGTALYRHSITLTKIANVAFLQSIPFVAILGFILFGEKITGKKVFYILIAFVGIILVSVKDFSSLHNFGKGEFYTLIAAFIFGLSFLSRRWMSDKLNDQEIALIIFAIGFVFTFFISFTLIKDYGSINWTVSLVLAVLLIGFINIVNLYLINFGFANVPPVLTSNILTLEALFGLILALIFYKEIPTLKELIGGVVIITSVIQMNRLEKVN